MVSSSTSRSKLARIYWRKSIKVIKEEMHKGEARAEAVNNLGKWDKIKMKTRQTTTSSKSVVVP